MFRPKPFPSTNINAISTQQHAVISRILSLSLVGVIILLSGATTIALAVRQAEYKIGQIPDQIAWYGAPLKFTVGVNEVGAGVTLSMEATPRPEGSVEFIPASGLFTYVPSFKDKSSFVVTFTATSAGGSVQQKVRISPTLRSEFGYINTLREKIDPASADYIRTTITKHAEQEFFNAAEKSRTRRSVNISGKTVIFEANSPQNDLYNTFNNNEDIREMAINAETLIIRSPLRLPQTYLVIRAKSLKFENGGSINTTPMSNWFAATPATLTRGPENGRGGHKGGGRILIRKQFYGEPREAANHAGRRRTTRREGAPGH